MGRVFSGTLRKPRIHAGKTLRSSKRITDAERDFYIFVRPRIAITPVGKNVVKKFVAKDDFRIEAHFGADAETVRETVLIVEAREAEMQQGIRLHLTVQKCMRRARAVVNHAAGAGQQI